MIRTIFARRLDEATATDPGNEVGMIRWEYQNAYRFVKNLTGGALAVGDVLFAGTSSPTHQEAYKMNQSAKGTNLGLMMGVVLAVAAAADFLFLQVFGYNASINMEGTTDIAVGDSLKGVNDQFYLVQGAAVATAPLYHRQVVAMEAYTAAAAALKAGFIHCL